MKGSDLSMTNQPYKGLLTVELNTGASVLESSCIFPWLVLVRRRSLLVSVASARHCQHIMALGFGLWYFSIDLLAER